MSIFGRDRAIARLLAAGLSEKEIATQLSISLATIRSRMRSPDFMKLVEEMSQRIDERIEEKIAEELEKLEYEAAQQLRTLFYSKDEKVRFQAIESALDRAGKRGKPAERIESKTATLDLNRPVAQELRSALRDPSVQEMLQRKPEVAAELLLEAGSPEEVELAPDEVEVLEVAPKEDA